jgi:hypothetical protein
MEKTTFYIPIELKLSIKRAPGVEGLLKRT